MEVCAVTALVIAEAPYAFRERLVCVHRQDRRDFSQKVGESEFEFQNGAQIVVPDVAPVLTRRSAEDFCDYLLVSMGVNASVRTSGQPMRPGLSRLQRLYRQPSSDRMEAPEDAGTLRQLEMNARRASVCNVEDGYEMPCASSRRSQVMV